ncbi:hypothetical protein QCA50_002800 [Cerrena zonata]|uniref:UBC core domain-containing protein n=1 Tax=Cerrena zonata TaxID=2478898 RepID=A0AAW0GUV0_9APHY
MMVSQEWHCTLRGPAGTEFEGGIYHFRILLPSEYPFRPPSIMMLTPNGRFELNTKICISFTNYHEELWQPAWGVRTAIIGLQGFFPLKGTAAVGVGALEYPTTERKRLASLSRQWVCPTCNKPNLECLPDPESKPHQHSEGVQAGSTSEPNIETDISNAATDVLGTVSASTPSDANNSNQPMAEPSPPVPAIQQPVTPPLKVVAPTPQRPSIPSPLIIAPPRISTPPPTSANSDDDEVDPARPAALDIKVPGAPRRRQVPEQTQIQTQTAVRPPIIIHKSTPRPPIILDTAICVMLVLVFGLVCRRIL